MFLKGILQKQIMHQRTETRVCIFSAHIFLKVCSKCSGHMTKVAAVLIYSGKTPLRSSADPEGLMILGFGM